LDVPKSLFKKKNWTINDLEINGVFYAGWHEWVDELGTVLYPDLSTRQTWRRSQGLIASECVEWCFPILPGAFRA
jgi:hypothetical protein